MKRISAPVVSSLAALLVAGFAYGAEPPARPSTLGCTTVIVVRHAEQTDPDETDPPLSEAGQDQAKALAAAVAHSGVQAIYVTQFQRTKDTAALAARELRVPVIEVPVDRAKLTDHGSLLAKQILAEHPGGIVLVVGHSNTVPSIVDALAHVKIRPIEKTEFDRFIIVSAGEKSCEHVLEAQYGHM